MREQEEGQEEEEEEEDREEGQEKEEEKDCRKTLLICRDGCDSQRAGNRCQGV